MKITTIKSIKKIITINHGTKKLTIATAWGVRTNNKPITNAIILFNPVVSLPKIFVFSQIAKTKVKIKIKEKIGKKYCQIPISITGTAIYLPLRPLFIPSDNLPKLSKTFGPVPLPGSLVTYHITKINTNIVNKTALS